MMFVDNLLMFARGDDPFGSLLFVAFNKFSTVSGLEDNLLKSEVYLVGASPSVAEAIIDKLGISRGTFPFKYLFFPQTND